MNITMNELSKIVAELKIMNTMAMLMPESERTIILEEGDKKELGDIDLSYELNNLKQSIYDVLNAINDKADEIYTNAVDEREGYPEDSMAKRPLWLDEVQGAADNLRCETNISLVQ